MALSINTNFGGTCFTCDLPDLSITTTQPSVVVTLRENGSDIFSGTYYALSGTVVVHDIASIFEAYFLKNDKTVGAISIYVNDGVNSATTSFNLIYCRMRSTSQSAAEFFSDSFYTTATNRLTTIQCPQYLSCNLASGSHNVTIRMQVQRPNGEVVPYVWVKTIYASEGPVTTFDVHPADMQARAANLLNIPNAKLLSYTVTLGNRTCSFFIQHTPAARCFLFRNVFNCLEAISFPAATSAILETDFSEAVIGHRFEHYDVDHIYSYETQTGEILTAQAHFIEQFLTSPKIQLAITINGQYPSILIKEYDYKISDAPGEPNTLSFKWQLADNKLKLL